MGEQKADGNANGGEKKAAEIFLRDKQEMFRVEVKGQGKDAVAERRALNSVTLYKVDITKGEPQVGGHYWGKPVLRAYEGVMTDGLHTYPITREDGSPAQTLEEAFELHQASYDRAKDKADKDRLREELMRSAIEARRLGRMPGK